jgi:hypothetical protein
MSKIYKPTQILRATVDRQCRVVLEADPSAEEGCYRLVQILTDMPLYFSFDTVVRPDGVEVSAKPEEAAGGRDFLMAFLPASCGFVSPFPVLPHQNLYMMAASTPGTDHASLAKATLIVQHWRQE